MKILATKKSYNATLPPPPPTIWVGFMKCRFFTLFLSLLLSGCGGGDGSSSVEGSSSKKPQSCAIANGSGHKVWNKTAKKYSTICTVAACNAGFDNDEDPIQCQTTAADYYSPTKDKTRKQCSTTIPDHSLKNTATGSALETDCWNCKAGSLKNTSNKTCMLPDKGKYYDTQGTQQSCRAVDGSPSGGFDRWENNTAPVPSDDKCKFSCKSGFTKSDSLFSCNKSRACRVNNGGGLNLWDRNTNNFSTTCTLETCNAGYDNSQNPTQCQTTVSGFYSPANDKNRKACSTIPVYSFVTGRTGLSSSHDCWSCNSGYLKNIRGRVSCNFPRKGKYVNALGNEQSCNNVGGAPGGFNEFLDNTRGVNVATGCNFSCRSGYVNNSSTYSCNKAQSCAIANGRGQKLWNSRTNIYSATCEVVDCNTGLVKNTGGNTCDIPDQGKYADRVGDEQNCDTPTGATGGFDTFLPNTGAVATATGCGFSCNVVFVKNSENRTCNFPRKGKYLDGSGSEQSCDNVGGTAGGFNDFLDNTRGVNVATGCNFSCRSGYVKSVSDYSCTQGQTCPIANGVGFQQTSSAPCQVVDCNTGLVKNPGENTCDIPYQGKYADRIGDEQSCDPPTGATGGFNTFLSNTRAVATATGCGFSCNAGFVKNSGNRTCNFPRKGKYVNVWGREQSCNNIRGTLGGFNEFLDNTKGVSSAADCNFSCRSGYVKSVSDYSCTQGQTCPIANGAGFKATPTGLCQVVDCNAGYDSVANPAQCQPTASGFFSLSNDKTRTTCLAPANSSPTSNTMLSSAGGCYTCDGGYLKNTGENTCDVPSKGKYVNASGNEQSCSDPGGTSGGVNGFLDNTKGVSSATDCNFSCRSGYVKSVSDYSCTQGQNCSIANGVGVQQTSSASCQVVDCNTGLVKNTASNTCDIPDQGKYADRIGDEQSCDDPTGVAGGFKEFLANTGAVSTAAGCDFSCNAGFVKNTADRTCNIPDTGKYADASGDKQSCDDPTGVAGGFKEFLANTGAVSTAAGCDFSCNAGYMKDSSSSV